MICFIFFCQIIRELREEVEKLRSMIGGGADGTPADGKAISDLKEKLSISESLMAEMTRSWEDKLRETERVHQARQKALEDMGISVQASGIGVQVDKFYLVNLNADPSMNELLVCYLKVASQRSSAAVMKINTKYFPFNAKTSQFTDIYASKQW